MNNPILPNRKNMRLKGYDYSTPGVYFLTICVKGRECMLSNIVVNDDLELQNVLTEQGKIAEDCINRISGYYNNIRIHKYVIMPNHIHMLVGVIQNKSVTNTENGQSERFVPTREKSNSAVSKFVGTFKRFCNREYGENIWQYRFHDHVIRNGADYQKIWQYIDSNISKWRDDCFYKY